MITLDHCTLHTSIILTNLTNLTNLSEHSNRFANNLHLLETTLELVCANDILL